jgi:hypothetical protein
MFDERDLAPRPHHGQRGAGLGVLAGVVTALVTDRGIADAALFGVIAGTLAGALYGWLRRP